MRGGISSRVVDIVCCMSKFEILHERIAASFDPLEDKPEETPESTARALYLAAAGIPASAELALETALPELDDSQLAVLEELVVRRLAGEPLAHLTGRQRFMGIDFLASADALVPRKETELLGKLALEKVLAAGPAARVIDLCTGSGNLSIAIAARAAGADVHAADLSPEAVALARRNAALIGVADRVSFEVGDLFDALRRDRLAGTVDVVICNPPYISSAKVDAMPEEISAYEPRLAFDGGAFGLSIIGQLLKEAPTFLKPGGWLCFEVGKGQGPYWSKALARNASYADIETVADAAGDIRALAARRA